MAVEGPRRSGRVRKQVKSYAAEQAEEDEPTIATLPSKRKRKAAAEQEDFDQTDTAKPKKKSSKKTKSSTPEDVRSSKPATKTKETAKASSSKPKRPTTDRSWHGDAAERRIAINNGRVKPLKAGEQETRLKGYVSDPPDSYHDALKRANTERMYILERSRGVEEGCHAHHADCPCETVHIAGSKGNVYMVTISHLPSCTCPVGIFTKKGGEKLCKHALYVLHNVLKAPDRLKRQTALLTSELKELFANAPALPSEVVDDEKTDGNRKPMEDDCPICCMEFEENDEVVWCRAACGNNVHQTCFQQWAQTKTGQVTCPFCRTEWDYGETKTQKVGITAVEMPAARGANGYRNVRDQLEYD